MFLLCKTEKIRRTGSEFFFLHFRCANVHGLCGSIHWNLMFYSSASSHPIFVLFFALSVERPLGMHGPSSIIPYLLLKDSIYNLP